MVGIVNKLMFISKAAKTIDKIGRSVSVISKALKELEALNDIWGTQKQVETNKNE